jgi:hypothetical protein
MSVGVAVPPPAADIAENAQHARLASQKEETTSIIGSVDVVS